MDDKKFEPAYFFTELTEKNAKIKHNSKEQRANLVRDLTSEIVSLTKQLRDSKQHEIDVYKDLRVEDSYHSNVIEGTKITISETKEIFEHMTQHIYKGSTSSQRDIVDYINAQRFMLENYQRQNPLTKEYIIKLQEYVCQTSSPHKAGYLRYAGMNVTAGYIDVGYTKGLKVEQEFSELLDNWNATEHNNDVMFFVELIKFKYRFLRIHPFPDGNGRVSRLLLNQLLLTRKMFPLIVMVDDKQNYIRAIQDTQRNDDDYTYYYIALAQIYVRELREYAHYIRPITRGI